MSGVLPPEAHLPAPHESANIRSLHPPHLSTALHPPPAVPRALHDSPTLRESAPSVRMRWRRCGAVWRRVPDGSLNWTRGCPSRSRVAGVTDSSTKFPVRGCRGSRFRALCYAARMTAPVSADTPEIAALRVTANAGDAPSQRTGIISPCHVLSFADYQLLNSTRHS